MQEFCCFIVFLGQYICSFVLPKISGRGATAPLATPLNPPLGMDLYLGNWKGCSDSTEALVIVRCWSLVIEMMAVSS